MAKKTTPKRKNKPEQDAPPAPGLDVGSMELWRGIARACVPGEEDKWKVGEMATAHRLMAQGIIAENWEDINRMAGKGGKVSISFTLLLDRTGDVPHVKLEGSPKVERPKWKAESDVPDPDQDDLPGLVAAPEPESEPQQEPEPPTEDEDHPGVHSADEQQ